ncbi:hypothetical protein [Streptomyces sp. NPDC096013]|uniref:hypothetical protein n=1 Tax=Streptomyces sp. NPDC096013 TaxID=3366069 RepID=UPI003800CBF5
MQNSFSMSLADPMGVSAMRLRERTEGLGRSMLKRLRWAGIALAGGALAFGALAGSATAEGTAARALPADSSVGVPHIVEGTPVTIPVASGGYPGRAAAQAVCPGGEVLTGGGVNVTAGNSHAERYELHSTKPAGGGRWWGFATNTDSADPGTIQAYAICAKVIRVHRLD